MPYEGEFAQYGPLKRIVESERVREKLNQFEIQHRDVDTPVDFSSIKTDLKPTDWLPDLVLAIDGSNLAHSVKNGYPGAEVGYITIAAVIINVAKQRELDTQRPVDPKEFRATQKPSSLDEVIPGSNVVFKGNSSAKGSMRKALYEMFRERKISSDGETLLETYEALLKYKPHATTNRQRCPYDDDGECGSTKIEHEYFQSNGKYNCGCNILRDLYSTDALRIHEGMVPEGSNGTMYSETMQVLERIFLVHILRTMEQKGWLSSLKRIALIVDGPLAVFGRPAWLSQAIYKEISRINSEYRKISGNEDLMLLGVEKTGLFVDHFALLDKKNDGSYGAFPNESIVLLTDEYIKKHIIFSNTNGFGKQYGKDTYFGRKILYKTSSGARIVAVTPFLDESHRDLSRAEINQHPRLLDVMNLLNKLVSSRFPNALTPIVEANAEAAIPLHLGTKVLENLARELMNK